MDRVVVVASGGELKAAAVADAVLEFWGPGVAIESNPVPSGVSEQPMGLEETRRGAEHRLSTVQANRPDADLWVAIENGVIPFGDHHLDLAVVLVAQDVAGPVGVATSTGVGVATAIVDQAVARGTTIGDVIAGRCGVGDGKDPHAELTAGLRTRRQLLKEAVVTAYGVCDRL